MSKEIRISFKNFPIFFLILVTTSSLVNSQQEASFSLYMFNHQLINPAYVGAQDYTQITMTNRSQWQQFQGAPITQSFNIGHRFRSKIALGASVVHDKIGPLKNTSASLDFAYHLNLNNKNLKLSLGLKFTRRYNSLDYSIINPLEDFDITFSTQPENDSKINFGTGFYLHNEKFYLGVGIPNILKDDLVGLKRNYYLITGGLIKLNNSFQLKPSLLFQATHGNDLIYDNSILVVFKNGFWLGPQYRAKVNSFLPNPKNSGYYGVIAGIHLNKSMSLGYAYQGSLANQAIGITNTSHEVLLRIHLVPNVKGFIRSPRLF